MGWALLGLSLLTSEFTGSLLLICHVPCQVLFQILLGFPNTILRHFNHIPVISPVHMFLLPLVVHFSVTPQFVEANPYSAMLVSSLPYSISYTQDGELLIS